MIDFTKYLFDDVMKDVTIMPLSCNPSKFKAVTFRGYGVFNLIQQDIELQEILELAKINLSYIVMKYKEDFVFTDPLCIFKPYNLFEEASFSIKIGMLEKKTYDKIMEDKKNELSTKDDS